MSNADWVSLSASHDMPIVVSYYTDLFYKRDAYELARSCQVYDLDYHIVRVTDLKSWEANTNYKPTFLLRMAELYPCRAIVWLDADARVRQFPKVFERLRSVIAFHRWFGYKPASGTVYLASTPQRIPLIKEWIRQVEKSAGKKNDQVCMGRACHSFNVRPRYLTVEYCWIFDHQGIDLSSKPVIEHMQASRWTKKCKLQQRPCPSVPGKEPNE